jgi:hypothetical protein
MKNFLVALVFLLTGCAKSFEIHHGYTFNDVSKLNDKVEELKAKKSTKKK